MIFYSHFHFILILRLIQTCFIFFVIILVFPITLIGQKSDSFLPLSYVFFICRLAWLLLGIWLWLKFILFSNFTTYIAILFICCFLSLYWSRLLFTFIKLINLIIIFSTLWNLFNQSILCSWLLVAGYLWTWLMVILLVTGYITKFDKLNCATFGCSFCWFV